MTASGKTAPGFYTEDVSHERRHRRQPHLARPVRFKRHRQPLQRLVCCSCALCSVAEDVDAHRELTAHTAGMHVVNPARRQVESVAGRETRHPHLAEAGEEREAGGVDGCEARDERGAEVGMTLWRHVEGMRGGGWEEVERLVLADEVDESVVRQVVVRLHHRASTAHPGV